MTTLEPQTVAWAPWIWDAESVALDDPAELFHEASRLYPRLTSNTAGASLLTRDPALRASARRATKRTVGIETVVLPDTTPSAQTWEHVVSARLTRRRFSPDAVPLETLAAVLRAAYGLTHEHDGVQLRATPSAGALYPLELYALSSGVEGLRAGVYHFDPLRDVVTLTEARDLENDLAAASPYPELLAGAAVVVVITGMFWRTRFKYGLRGYRFLLLEAGHVGQSLLLAAAAHGLAAAPIGGFFDRRLDAIVGADGLDEASLYAIAAGWPA